MNEMVAGILSPVHVAFLLVIAVLLFGAKRLPELGNSLGSGLRDFKESLEGKDAHAPGRERGRCEPDHISAGDNFT